MDLLQAALAADPTYPAILTNLVIQLVFWTLYFELSPSYIWKPLLQGMPFWKRCNGLKSSEGIPLHNEILLGVLLPPFSSRPPPRRHAPHPLPHPLPCPQAIVATQHCTGAGLMAYGLYTGDAAYFRWGGTMSDTLTLTLTLTTLNPNPDNPQTQTPNPNSNPNPNPNPSPGRSSLRDQRHRMPLRQAIPPRGGGAHRQSAE